MDILKEKGSGEKMREGERDGREETREKKEKIQHPSLQFLTMTSQFLQRE